MGTSARRRSSTTMCTRSPYRASRRSRPWKWHDLNNLLAIIIGNLDLLQEHIRSNPDAAEILDEALQASLQGADLNQCLLAFARRQPLQPKRVDLNGAIDDMTNLLRLTPA